MATVTQLQEWMAQAESARHDLAMGAAVVEFWRDGRRVSYNQRTLPQLQTYIDQLVRDLDKAQAELDGRPRRRAISTAFN